MMQEKVAVKITGSLISSVADDDIRLTEAGTIESIQHGGQTSSTKVPVVTLIATPPESRANLTKAEDAGDFGWISFSCG